MPSAAEIKAHIEQAHEQAQLLKEQQDKEMVDLLEAERLAEEEEERKWEEEWKRIEEEEWVEEEWRKQEEEEKVRAEVELRKAVRSSTQVSTEKLYKFKIG